MATSNRGYRALVARSTGADGGTFLHLVRDDAETSLCGIPRAQLHAAGGDEEVVCPECIAWLPRRLGFSEQHPKVER